MVNYSNIYPFVKPQIEISFPMEEFHPRRVDFRANPGYTGGKREPGRQIGVCRSVLETPKNTVGEAFMPPGGEMFRFSETLGENVPRTREA